MNTATFKVAKHVGSMTGKIRYTVSFSINNSQEYEIPFWSFKFFWLSMPYTLTPVTEKGFSITHPVSKKKISLGPNGGKINLDTWTKIPQRTNSQ